MSKYASARTPAFRRHNLAFDEWDPKVYVRGNSTSDWTESAVPAQMGYWGVTHNSRAINAFEAEPGNLATWVMNIPSMVGLNDKRFVSLGAAIQRREQQGEKLDGWRALMGRVGLAQDVSHLDRAIDWDDVAFDAKKAYQEFAEASPGLLRAMEESGRDPEILTEARNRDHFMFLRNKMLTQARVNQEMDAWDDQAGVTAWIASKVQSGITNYLLSDPTTAPSIVLPFGVFTRAGHATAVATSTLRAGRAVGLPSAVARGAARTAAAPFAGGAAMHAGLARVSSHALAVSAEMAFMGAGFSATYQQQRNANWNFMWDDPSMHQQFSWSELGWAAGITGFFGFGVGTITKNVFFPRLAETKAAHMVAAGGSVSHPYYHSFSAARAGAQFDDLGVSIHRSAETIMPGRADELAFLIDDRFLSDAGLERLDVSNMMTNLARLREFGAEITPAQIMSEISQAAQDARLVAGSLSGAEGMLLRAAQARGAALAGTATDRAAVSARTAEGLLGLLEDTERHVGRFTPSAKSLPGLRNQLQELEGIANVRDLTPTELNQYVRLRQAMTRLGEPGIDTARILSYASPVTPRFLMGGRFGALTQAVQELESLRMAPQTPEIAARIKSREDFITARSAKLTREAQMESAEIAAERAAVPTPPSSAEAVDRLKHRMDTGDITLPESVVATDGNMVSWFSRTLFGPLSNFALRKTGQKQTIKSVFASVRRMSEELDTNKMTTSTMDGTGVAKTATSSKYEAQRMSNQVMDEMDRLVQSGKFGSKLNYFGFSKRVTDFQTAGTLHASNQRLSTDPDVIAMARRIREILDTIGDVAEQSGRFQKLKDFVPIRPLVGMLAKHGDEAVGSMARFFQRRWVDSPDIHWDTLVEMGLAERVMSRDGTNVRAWKGVVELDGFSGTKRSELTPDIQELYTAFIGSPNAFWSSAQRTIRHLLHTDTADLDAPRLTRAHGPASEMERQLDPAVLLDPDLAKFFDTEIIGVLDHYLKTTGFRVLNDARHAEVWGVPGLRMRDTIKEMERRAMSLDLSPEDAKMASAHFRVLQQKLAAMEGRLGSVMSESDTIGSFLTDVAVAAVPAVLGAPVGGTIVGVEAAISTVARVHHPTQIVGRVFDAMKVLRASFSRQQIREIMGDLSLAARINNQATLERLTGGSITSGHNWSLPQKLLQPWHDVWNILAGNAARNHFDGRVGSRWDAIPMALKAVASNQMTLGGSDIASNFSRMMQLVTLQRETGHFFRAAEKLAQRMADGGRQTLKQTFDDELTKQLSKKGVNRATAERRAAAAELRVYGKLAREAGFSGFMGGNSWQVAKRLDQRGLLDLERLAVLRRAGEATGGLKDRGIMRIVDHNKLTEYVTMSDPAEARRFTEAHSRLMDSYEDVIHKRVSEHTILNQPIDAQERTNLGRIHNSYATFMRSFFDNNIMDMAQMPLRPAVGMLAGYMFLETMTRVFRDWQNGMDLDDIIAEAEANPSHFIAMSITRSPLLGQYTPFLQFTLDHMTNEDRPGKFEALSGAGPGTFSNGVNSIMDLMKQSTAEGRENGLNPGTVRFLKGITPGYNSFVTGLLTAGVDEVADTNFRETRGGGQHRTSAGSYRRARSIRNTPPDVEAILPRPVTGPLQVSPLSFMEDE